MLEIRIVLDDAGQLNVTTSAPVDRIPLLGLLCLAQHAVAAHDPARRPGLLMPTGPLPPPRDPRRPA